ncbi:hypothetical protein BDW02DRAFT_51238 [Decorospora gaudefroyi]|uniref:F-box domain-containing protein n=1 Tax=Decorospora gaudefroyi TaxID=184978 RepID=A0A6A5KRF5_9PLEO|nr:hypothetical protein BDW02DRAFT_51238 [Decorospora gaudefroyi]
MCKFDIPTTTGCNAALILRTLQARPDLGKHTRYLRLVQCDLGFNLRRILGWYGWQSLALDTQDILTSQHFPPDAALPYRLWTDLTAKAKPITTSMEPSFDLVCDILRLLPNLLGLNRMLYLKDSPCDPFLEMAISSHGLPTESHPFAHLQQIQTVCFSTLSRLWPLFSLPVLRTLRLRYGRNTPTDPSQIASWTDASSSLESIDIENLILAGQYGYDDTRDPLRLMSNACDKLQTLSITTVCSEKISVAVLLRSFVKHIDTLHSLTVYESRPQLSKLPATRIPFRNKDMFGRLRSAKALRTLKMDVVDLLSLTTQDERNKRAPGVLRRKCYRFPHAPEEEYYFFVDLELLPSLVSLTLRIADVKDQ